MGICCSTSNQHDLADLPSNSKKAIQLSKQQDYAPAIESELSPSPPAINVYERKNILTEAPSTRLAPVNENKQFNIIKDFSKVSGEYTMNYTMNDVSKYNCIQSGIWIVIDGTIYDITPYITSNLHPATNEFIEPYYGKDVTEPFYAAGHSLNAIKSLNKYKIGQLHESEIKHNETDDSISIAPDLDQFINKSTVKPNNIYVSSLFIYPVKGCSGISVESAQLTSSGFLNDRIYAFCNKKTKKVINQLTYPQLAMIKVCFIENDNGTKGIVLNDKLVPFIKDKIIKVRWKSCSTEIDVYDQGEEISQWITSYINEENEEFLLVRVHENNYRETEEYFALNFAPKSSQKMSGFQNYCSVLLSSEESLSELNKRYKQRDNALQLSDDDEKEINWNRFRMNIIVKGLPTAHYEDFMKHINFGDCSESESETAEILWSRRRYFCPMPQVNQINGKKTHEPLATARRYRNAITLNDRTSLPGDKAVFFGSFYCVKHSGIIKIGQNVISKHEQLNYDIIRTQHGASYFNLNEKNIGPQFAINYHSQYQPFKLIQKEKYNHDTIKFRFKIVDNPDENENKAYHSSLKESLKMGDHYLLKYISDTNNEQVIRAFTPIFYDDNNNENDEMCFDLLVKIYPNGKMSQYLKNMRLSNTILCKQDYGKICYIEMGKVRFGDPRFTMFLPYILKVKQFNLIGAGSGITPLYQIIKNIHLNKQFDQTQISIIYCNKSVKDILLKDELEDIAKKNKNIKIHFVIETVNDTESIPNDMDIGRITKNICIKHLFSPNNIDNDVISLLCGPFLFEKAVKQFLNEIGYDKTSVASF